MIHRWANAGNQKKNHTSELQTLLSILSGYPAANKIEQMLTLSPYILYSDGAGNIFEDTTLHATGRTGWDAIPVPNEEWIELPEGGQLYELPGRRGIGIDAKTGEMRLCEKGWAVAAFIPPAHTGFYLAAYETAPDAPTLPLFCYTAAAWLDSKFYVHVCALSKI